MLDFCTIVDGQNGSLVTANSRTMLRDPRGGRIPAQNRLEQVADDRMHNDQPMRRDLEREPFRHRTKQPRWCPAGLTKSQKRRVQRLRQLEILEEEQE